MSTLRLRAVVDHIRTLAGSPDTPERTDRQLLEEFTARQDQAAFAGLVRRHGRLVWGVCRHVLGHEQDAEDAFQAAFLVLARKADSIRKGEALAGWLHGVAFRTAMKAKRDAARRRYHEGRAKSMPPRNPSWDVAWREVQAVLDEEVQRLPEKYRSVFVLCCLEGHGRAEAARQLGVKEGTVWSRLAQARKLLQQRLTRRGVALSAALAAAAVAPGTASATVPALLAKTATEAALLFSAGKATADSAQAVALAKAVMQTLLVTKPKGAIPVLVVLGFLAASAGLAAHHLVGPERGAPPPAAPKPAAKGAEQPAPSPQKQAHTDRYGDPMPPGALARLGTVRLRPGGSVQHLAFSPDGKRLASWSERGLSVWDTASGRELRQVELPGVRAYAVAWLDDGRGVAALQLGDESFYVWDFTDEKAKLPPRIPRPTFGRTGADEDQQRYGCFFGLYIRMRAIDCPDHELVGSVAAHPGGSVVPVRRRARAAC